MHAGNDVADPSRHIDAHRRDMGRRISRRQDRHTGRRDRFSEFGELDRRLFYRAHLRQPVLRDARGDPQALGVVDQQQRFAGNGHFAELGQTLRDDTGDGRPHRRMVDDDRGLPLRRLRGVELGLRLVHRRLADEALLPQAQHALVVGAGIDKLRRGAGGCLGRFAGIDLHQQITFPDRLSGIHIHVNDPAGDLRRQRRLIHRFDDCFRRQRQLDRLQLYHPRRQGWRVRAQRSRTGERGEQRPPAWQLKVRMA